MILQALDPYVTKNIDFIDTFHAIYLREEGLHKVLPYDRKHFKRVPWLGLAEP